ncbi:hypothetical protein BN1708_011282, partial [Verticillium longisporum]
MALYCLRPQRRASLLCNAMSQRRGSDTPRLSDGDDTTDGSLATVIANLDRLAAAPGLGGQELRHLRRLSGTRLTNEHDDVVLADLGLDLVAMGPDGEFLAGLEQDGVFLPAGRRAILGEGLLVLAMFGGAAILFRLGLSRFAFFLDGSAQPSCCRFLGLFCDAHCWCWFWLRGGLLCWRIEVALEGDDLVADLEYILVVELALLALGLAALW